MKKMYIWMILTALMFSCGSKDSENITNSTIDLNDAIETAQKRKPADPNASGGNKCLMDYQTKIASILSESEVINLTGFSSNNMKIDLRENEKYPNSNELKYLFRNKRIGKVEGISYELELPDFVKISAIAPMSISDFEKQYRAVSEEEMNNAKQILDDAVEGDIDDAEAKAAMEKLEQSNIEKEQVKKVGRELMGLFQKVSESYVPIENMGDRAVWNTYTQELIVLKNGVKFEVQTEVSNESVENKKLALKIATLVLSKCK
jgi:hypothetical protein